MQNAQLLVLLIVASLSFMLIVPFGGAANVTSTANTSTASTANTASTTSTTASSTTTALPLRFLNLYLSNSTASQGQREALTALVSGGEPPYVYSFFATNALTGNAIFSTMLTSAGTSNTAGFLLPITQADTGLIAINVNVTDSSNSLVSGSNSISVSALQSSTTTSATTTATTSVSTTTTPAVPIVNSTAIAALVSGYNSGLVNGTAGGQFNTTSALNVAQLNAVTAHLLEMNVSVNHVQTNVSYGAVSQSGKMPGAGKTLYFVQYDGNNSATEYTVSIIKRVPDLHVKIGNFITNSSMGNMTLLQSVYGRSGNRLYPQSTYSLNPQIFSSTSGLCLQPPAYCSLCLSG